MSRFAVWARDERGKIDQTTVEKAWSVALSAHGAPETMDQNWGDGVFTVTMLKEWADRGEMDTALGAVPIVAAWRSVITNSSEGGYEFKIPKHHPRNPDNLPDELVSRFSL